MCAASHAFAGFFGGEKSAEREAAADPLCDGHDVRHHACDFIGKELAEPPYAALHFIENQQESMFVAKFAHGLQMARRNDPNSAFALNGFDEDGCGFGADRSL